MFELLFLGAALLTVILFALAVVASNAAFKAERALRDAEKRHYLATMDLWMKLPHKPVNKESNSDNDA